MAQLLLRQLDDTTKERLRRRAARHGRSMEAEARAILRDAVADEDAAGGDEGMGTRIARLFAEVGLTDEEFEAFRRGTEAHRGDPDRNVDFGA